LNVKRQETYEKKENKASLGCGLGQQFAFIKNRVKKYEWTIVYLFFTISNANNLTCISTIKNVNQNIVLKLKQKYH
jgi:hypothetical protein